MHLFLPVEFITTFVAYNIVEKKNPVNLHIHLVACLFRLILQHTGSQHEPQGRRCDFFIILHWPKPQINAHSFMLVLLNLSDVLTGCLNEMG